MTSSGECRRRLDDPIAPIVLLAHAWAARLSKRPDRPHAVTPGGVDDFVRGLPDVREVAHEVRLRGQSGVGFPHGHRLVQAPPIEVRAHRPSRASWGYIDWNGVKSRTGPSAVIALSSAVGSPRISPETDAVARIH